MLSAPGPHRGSSRGGSRDASRRPHSRNKAWTPADGNTRTHAHAPDGERWERGGHRGGGRGRHHNKSWRNPAANGDAASASGAEDAQEQTDTEVEVDMYADGGEEEEDGDADGYTMPEEPVLETQEEREKFYQELVKAREVERKKAIAEGKMDDPLVPKRLDEAITMVGTCMDMCPRFERYRRERENHLDKLELIPGTKRVDHSRAVKIYERAAGDKTLPSDLRPPPVLKRTLNYLFRELIAEKGFSVTQAFVRDRSRAVRNDFTMQHETGPVAIECHDRCARFHILALHLERDKPGFSVDMEDQQLMNTLQSLKEFYEDQRGKYNSPTELEMRIYHRLIHIRDQKERHDDIPPHVANHPVFQLTTNFRLHVQKKSAPITKKSALVVDEDGMRIFAELAGVLREQGNMVMVYLVACILERHFGKGTIEDIEAIHGGISISDIIDGLSAPAPALSSGNIEVVEDEEVLTDVEDQTEEDDEAEPAVAAPKPTAPTSGFPLFSNATGSSIQPSPFGAGSPFGIPSSSAPASAFSSLTSTSSVFGTAFPVVAPSSTGTPNSAFGLVGTTTAPTGAPSAFGGNKFTIPSGPIVPTVAAPIVAAPNKPPIPPSNSVRGAPVPLFPAASALAPPPTLNPGAPSFVPFNPSAVPVPAPIIQPVRASIPAAVLAPPAPPAPVAVAPVGFALSNTPQQLPVPRAAEPPFTVPTFSSKPLFGVASVAELQKPEAASAPVPAPVAKPVIPGGRTGLATVLNPTASSLKIDTNNINGLRPAPLSSFPALGGSGSASASTPIVPPNLSRRPPLSLPPTPTLNRPQGPPQPPTALLNFPKLSPTKPDVLSPLIPPSPGVTRFNAPGTTSFAFPPMPGASPMPPSLRRESDELVKDKQKEKEREDSQAIVDNFARKKGIVKRLFNLWLRKTRECVAYKEACRRSEAYARKIEEGKRMTPKKRPLALDQSESPEPPRHKWTRKKRPSSVYRAPQTDEALALRLKENHEEHERRWAPGTFLQTVRSRLARKATSPIDWHIWLSMNPENDGTAIWLEKKFDVPSSGAWVTQTVFSIPAAAASTSATTIDGSPGLVVFECTPLDAIDDELERKYRILDDCSRLRDVLAALPEERRYLPSLLLVIWADPENATVHADMEDMIAKCIAEDILADRVPFFITAATKDVDKKFTESLGQLAMDTDGKLAHAHTLPEIYEQLLRSYRSFASGWVTRCAEQSHFNWHLYGVLLNASISLLNAIVSTLLQLWGTTPVEEALEPIDFAEVGNSEDASSTTLAWLRRLHSLPSARKLTREIERSTDFPSEIFLDLLPALVADAAFARLPTVSRAGTRLLSRKTIDEAISSLQLIEEDYREELRMVQTMPPPNASWVSVDGRNTPLKRRAEQVEDGDTSLVNGYLFGAPKENGAKRQKVDIEEDPFPFMVVDPPVEVSNDRGSPAPTDPPSPSPSASTTVAGGESKAPVTLAMLRALTKSVRSKYGR